MDLDSNWAEENLKVIRTLMERSAIYRRALAPIMTFTGIVGLLAAGLALTIQICTPAGIISFWLGVNLVVWPGAFLLVRKQAIKDKEPFWSPPARRVFQAMFPASLAGLFATFLLRVPAQESPQLVWWLLPIWMVLYGLALYGAGFFMPRGVRLFGWMFFLSGCVLAVVFVMLESLPDLCHTHAVMGVMFGGVHLAYGVYLYFTEPRKNVA